MSYTDSTPLTSGSYIGLRTINTRARFDDVQANEMALSYLHGDHLGSNSLMTDAAGAVVPNSQAAYLPFGDWRNEPSTSDLTDVGYTGHRHNNTNANDLGLIYMNARYYLPGLGRFASADTLIPEPSNPQSYNRFSYVYNNPTKFNDPSGHVVCPGYDTILSFRCTDGDNPLAWWDNNRRFFVDGYGLFDKEHIRRGYDRGLDIIEQMQEAIANGGGAIILRDDKYNYIRRYWVSGDITASDFLGVALGIFMDFEYGFEELQSNLPGLTSLSGFSTEDLPSDYLGFWAAATGKFLEDIPLILQELGVVSVYSPFPSLVTGIGVDSLGNTTVGLPKNYSFQPMKPVVNFIVGQVWTSVPWPSDLQITPISNGSLWGMADLNFGNGIPSTSNFE